MNEAIVQALMQGLKVFVVAGLTALGADAANLVAIGTEGDLLTGPLVLSIISAVIVAALKAIGGPTQKVETTVGRGAQLTKGERPSILSV
jgi:hypothetical protein